MAQKANLVQNPIQLIDGFNQFHRLLSNLRSINFCFSKRLVVQNPLMESVKNLVDLFFCFEEDSTNFKMIVERITDHLIFFNELGIIVILY